MPVLPNPSLQCSVEEYRTLRNRGSAPFSKGSLAKSANPHSECSYFDDPPPMDTSSLLSTTQSSSVCNSRDVSTIEMAPSDTSVPMEPQDAQNPFTEERSWDGPLAKSDDAPDDELREELRHRFATAPPPETTTPEEPNPVVQVRRHDPYANVLPTFSQYEHWEWQAKEDAAQQHGYRQYAAHLQLPNSVAPSAQDDDDDDEATLEENPEQSPHLFLPGLDAVPSNFSKRLVIDLQCHWRSGPVTMLIPDRIAAKIRSFTDCLPTADVKITEHFYQLLERHTRELREEHGIPIVDAFERARAIVAKKANAAQNDVGAVMGQPRPFAPDDRICGVVMRLRRNMDVHQFCAHAKAIRKVWRAIRTLDFIDGANFTADDVNVSRVITSASFSLVTVYAEPKDNVSISDFSAALGRAVGVPVRLFVPSK